MNFFTTPQSYCMGLQVRTPICPSPNKVWEMESWYFSLIIIVQPGTGIVNHEIKPQILCTWEIMSMKFYYHVTVHGPIYQDDLTWCWVSIAGPIIDYQCSRHNLGCVNAQVWQFTMRVGNDARAPLDTATINVPTSPVQQIFTFIYNLF